MRTPENVTTPLLIALIVLCFNQESQFHMSILLLPRLKIGNTMGVGMKISTHPMESVHTQESDYTTIPVFSLDVPT